MSVMSPRKKAVKPPTPDQIRAIREARKLTKEEAAERVGITLRAWQQYEQGKRVPSLPMTILIRLLQEGKI